ncbi:DDE-type integrase/transposase/recombinase [Pseudidiomarina aestuarii]|uniref:DDE-type integrase/transposase/recombinase n=1 Tax=Pseudidiomarina aestuarii TaxID=624146 RepID=UPI003A96CC04
MSLNAPKTIAIPTLVEITGKSKTSLYRIKANGNWIEAGQVKRTDEFCRPVTLYLVDSLPEDIKAMVEEFFTKETVAASLQSKHERGEISLKELKRGKARHEIVVAADLYQREHGSGRKTLEAFCQAYNSKKIPLPNSLQDVVHQVSVAQLYRWRNTLNESGFEALCGRYNAVKRDNIIDSQKGLPEWLESYVYRFPHLSKEFKARIVLDDLKTENRSAKRGWRLPSESTLRRWLQNFIKENEMQIAFSTDIDRYNSAERPNFAMHWAGNQPNDLWELDGTPADIMCIDGRFKITGGIDAFTRRARCRLVERQTSQENLILVRQMINDFGMPNEESTIKTDNGSDYVSHRMTTAFHRLGLTQVRSAPYSGWEKPFIERFFKTISRDLFERLPGYIGHNVADRKKIENQVAFDKRLAAKNNGEAEADIFRVKLTREEVQKRIDEWIINVYEHQNHDGLKGKTPAQVYAESHYQPRKPNALALALLMNDTGTATVKAGRVRRNNMIYTAPEFMNMRGAVVEIFIDPENPRNAYALDIRNGYQNGELIQITSIDEVHQKGLVPALSQARKNLHKQLRAKDRELKSNAKALGLDTLYQRRIDIAKSIRVGVVEFERKAVKHENNLFNNAEKALQFGSSTTIAPTPQARDMADVISELDREKARIEAVEAPIKEARRKVIRSEQDIIQALVAKEIDEPLTESEKRRITMYELDDWGRLQVKSWREEAIYERTKRAENE